MILLLIFICVAFNIVLEGRKANVLSCYRSTEIYFTSVKDVSKSQSLFSIKVLQIYFPYWK